MNKSTGRSTTPHCTLYGIPARDGRSVVLVRRGPTKQATLLRWWLDSDRIEEGQWFKGYIYGPWCDLSPDGNYLLYFAGDHHRKAPQARHNGNYGTWSAISHPPFLTALALWPKGDTWSGGGLFLGPRHIALAHNAHDSDPKTLAPNFRLPEDWRVTEFEPPLLTDAATGKLRRLYSVEHTRLLRDGWLEEAKKGSPFLAYSRTNPRDGRTILTTGDKPPWRGFCVKRNTVNAQILRRIDGADWADFAPDGDLVLATGGCLYRVPAKRLSIQSDDPLGHARLIMDVRPLTFLTLAPTPEATLW